MLMCKIIKKEQILEISRIRRIFKLLSKGKNSVVTPRCQILEKKKMSVPLFVKLINGEKKNFNVAVSTFIAALDCITIL